MRKLKKKPPYLKLFQSIYFFSITLFLLFLGVSLKGFTQEIETIEDKNTLQILTPSLAKRQTEKIKLQNGLKALLISDPSLDKSGAALSVEAGSYQNPKEYLGLAHFLEHLLFLGTEKYPDESGYHRYLDEHGGLHNAFTASDKTVYMFKINNDAFTEGLDRFAQFFIAPLFSPSGIQREMNAIDQEYAKNIQQDGWRFYYVQKALENSEHPNSQFDIGNLQTIATIPPSKVKEWYQSHYSANLMNLVIYSTLPMDQLKALVLQDFGPIENKNLTQFVPTVPLKLESNAAQMVYITPYQDIRHLIMQWEMPIQLQYDTDIVAYILNSKAEKSLLNLLKKEGLADSISANTSLYNPSMLFSIEISLTDKGVKNYNQVITYVFETIELLKHSSIPKELFEEMVQLKTLDYEYQSREDVFHVVMDDASNLVDEDMATYPEKTRIGNGYNKENIDLVISRLKATNCHYFLLAKPELTLVTPNKKEKWLGAEYYVQKLPKEQLKKWDNASPSSLVQLPTLNPYVATNLELKSAYNDHLSILNLKPLKLIDNDAAVVYLAQDEYFLQPNLALSFKIHTPQRKPGNSNQEVLLELYIECIKQRLAEELSLAQNAGLQAVIEPIESGLQLQIVGFNDKAYTFFTKIVDALTHFKVDDQTFYTQKELLEKDYANVALSAPLQQGLQIAKSILHKNFVTSEKKAQAIKSLSKEALLRYANHLYNKTYVQGLIYGNINQEEAKKFYTHLMMALDSETYATDLIPKKMILKLNPEKGPFAFNKKIDQAGNFTLLIIQDGCFTLKKEAAFNVLGSGIQEPFFSELRTKQQTGYIVKAQNFNIENELMQYFLTQSNTHDAQELTSRFELFIENCLKNFENDCFTKERFETIRQSLVDELKQPPTNMLELAGQLNSLAFDYDADFNLRLKKIEALEELSYEEFVQLSKAFLGRENKKRLSIQIQGMIDPANDIHYTFLPSIQRVRAMGEFLSKEQNRCNDEE